MGRFAVRLLAGRLRRQRLSSLLVVVVLAAAGAAGTSAILLRSAVSQPWDRVFDATSGAHVHVSSFGELDAGALARLPGVADSSGPVNSFVQELRHDGRTAGVALAVIPAVLQVDRPAIAEGSWRSGAIVLERSFARALSVRVGEHVQLRGASGWSVFEVSGIALSVRTPGYPATVPGSAFADPATAEVLGADGPRLTTVGLRLADGSDEATVAEAASAYGVVKTASEIRAEALSRTRQFQVVLASFAVLLLGASAFLVAVLLAARLRAQRRELVLLRLIGLTPAQLLVVIAIEQAVLAAVGGLLGTAVALAGAGMFSTAAATALGSTAPGPSIAVLGVIGALVVTAAAVGALAARRTAGATLGGLSPAATPRTSTATGRFLSAGLPAPIALVAKDCSSSRGRALATVLAVTLAVMTAVSALGMEATFRHSQEEAAAASVAPPLGVPPADPGEEESGLRTLVYGLQGLLGLVALTSVVAVGLVGIAERRRELAVLRAIGFSIRQLAGSTVAGQGLLAGLGALAGIPLGLGFFRLAYAMANGSSAGLVDAPLLHLAAVVPASVLLAGTVASLPASTLRRITVRAALASA